MQPDQNIVELLRFIVRCNPLDLSESGVAPTAPIKDWDAFVALAEKHRIGPLCHAVLQGTSASLPAEAAQALVRVRERHTLLNLSRAAELLQVLDAFHEAKVAAMPFKGVALAAQLYGDFTLRAAGDLDLLIRWEDAKRASEIILERGYRLTTTLGRDGQPTTEGLYEYRFERAFDGMVLELHWSLNFVHPRFQNSIGLEWIGQSRQTVRVSGREVQVLDAEMTLLLLCMHGSKHRWSRLNWVCDVAQMVRISPNLDWDRMKAGAKIAGLRKAVALGLMLANSLSGVACLAEVIRELDSLPSVRTVAERLALEIPESTGQEWHGFLSFHARLMDRPDLLHFLFSHDALRPTASDEAFLALPPSLRWLHVLIRPFRLLFDRSAR